MTELLRRLLCRAGRHHVIRCAGRPDHGWRWNEARHRWEATLRPGPAAALAPVHRDSRGVALRAAPVPRPRDRRHRA